MLSPIWDEGADKISAELSGQSVLVGKIDCDAESNLGTRLVERGARLLYESFN